MSSRSLAGATHRVVCNKKKLHWGGAGLMGIKCMYFGGSAQLAQMILRLQKLINYFPRFEANLKVSAAEINVQSK